NSIVMYKSKFMQKILINLAYAFIVISLTSCISTSSLGPSEDLFEQAEMKLPEYTVTRNTFFGYELNGEYNKFGMIEGKSHNTLKDLQTFSEIPKEGPFNEAHITTYKRENKIIQLNFIKRFSNEFESVAFYGSALRSLRENYPANTVKSLQEYDHSVECTSSKKNW